MTALLVFLIIAAITVIAVASIALADVDRETKRTPDDSYRTSRGRVLPVPAEAPCDHNDRMAA